MLVFYTALIYGNLSKHEGIDGRKSCYDGLEATVSSTSNSGVVPHV